MSDPKPTPPTPDRLTALLGFDPTAPHRLSESVFAEVVGEITQERTEETKKRAKTHLLKAIELRDKRVAAERAFRSEIQKFDKELGKVFKQIEGMLSGNATDDTESKDE